jgi:acyl carrier protein
LENLKSQVKELIITSLNLEDVTAESIDDAAPLFKEGLGLDSIDALELAVAIERKFRVTIPDEAVGKQAFSSVDSLTAYIKQHLPQ